MYKENKDITLQYYNQNAGSFVSGTVHADLTDTLNRFSGTWISGGGHRRIRRTV